MTTPQRAVGGARPHQLLDALVLLVLVVGEVGTQGAAPVVGSVGVDAGAALTEDAGPPRGEPGQVAAERLVLVLWVDELGERPRERQQHFRHGAQPRPLTSDRLGPQD